MMSNIFLKNFFFNLEKEAGIKKWWRSRHNPKWAEKEWVKRGFTAKQAKKLVKIVEKKD